MVKDKDDRNLKLFSLLRDSANYFFSNEKYDEASTLYEKASIYFDSPEIKLNAVLTYIKLASIKTSRKFFYLKKALSYLNSLSDKWDNPMVSYYRAIVLSFMGEYKEASQDFEKVYENVEDFSDFVVAGLNIKNLLPHFDTYVYDYLYEKPLVKLYKILSSYEIDESRVRLLKNIFGEEDPEMAKAREIKRLYRIIFENGKFSDMLWSTIAKQEAVALLYIWGENEKTYGMIRNNSNLYFILTEKLPPLTALLLDRISGIDFKTKGIPFFVKLELDKVRDITLLFKNLKSSKNVNEFLLSILDFIEKNDVDIKPMNKERIYRSDLIRLLREILFVLMDKLHSRVSAYYSSKESSNFMKAVVETLPLSEREKKQLYLVYSS